MLRGLNYATSMRRTPSLAVWRISKFFLIAHKRLRNQRALTLPLIWMRKVSNCGQTPLDLDFTWSGAYGYVLLTLRPNKILTRTVFSQPQAIHSAKPKNVPGLPTTSARRRIARVQGSSASIPQLRLAKRLRTHGCLRDHDTHTYANPNRLWSALY
jgi:hypothetical protein